MPEYSFTKTSGVVPGKVRLYLYEGGTGSRESGVNDFYVSIGDTITIDVFLKNNDTVPVAAIEIYLTVDDSYFDIVSQGINEESGGFYGHFKPFIQGEYFKGVNGTVTSYGNNTHGDSLTARDNIFLGWQLDYIEKTGPDVGFGKPVSKLRYGVAATFQLIAKAPCDSVSFTLDKDFYFQRVSCYHDPYANDTFYFKTFTPCYITVSGIEIDPPLPDILMGPGTTDSSLDLDDHVGLSSIPDSLFTWEASGNENITVTIEPETHVVTFEAPQDFQGYEDIVFTLGDGGMGVSAADTLRVTVDAPPSFTDAFPDTVYIHEDSLEVAMYLRDIVEDEDDAFEDLTMFITPGENLNYSTVNDSLYIQGVKDYFGTDSLKVAVYDPLALGDSLTVPVVVLSVNDPPVLSDLPDVNIERNEIHQFDMSDYAGDVDGDELTISWDTPEHFTIQEDRSQITLEGVPGFLGSEELVFTVTDPNGLAASDSMLVTVTPATKSPVWSGLPKVGFAQNQADSSLVLWDFVYDPDDADSLLTFEITNDEDVDFWEVNYRNGRLYLYDIDDTAGYDRLTVTAFDPDGNYSSAWLNVYIAPADGTPIVGGIPDTTIVADTQSNWIDLDNYYYDLDNVDSQMTWTWGRIAGADSSVTISINPRSHLVTLKSIDPDIFSSDKIFFTVTDPGGKYGDDICDITVLEDLMKPVLNLPPKVGFIAGKKDNLDLDDYSSDSEYLNSELTWTWSGNVKTVITLLTPDDFYTRPVSFTGSADWTGWEQVWFTVINPMGGAAIDTLTVFSVPDDGSPVAGGLTGLTLKAGECIYVDLDDYYYDADTQDHAVIWTVSGNDSISVDIDPLSHIAHICALSETWQGQETLQFTVTDPLKNSDSMGVVVKVTDAVLRNVFSAKIFRNPMQEDFMDIFISSTVALSGIPSLTIEIGEDSTDVAIGTVGTNYFYGRYLLPIDTSLGARGVADAIINGFTSDGIAVQDTSNFAYGLIGVEGGKIAIGSMILGIPGEAFDKPEFITVVPDTHTGMNSSKTVPSEITFTGETYCIGPPSLRSLKPLCLGFSTDSGVSGAGVYRRENNGWEFIGADTGQKTVQADIYGSGTYRLGYDRIPPQLKLLEPEGDILKISAADYGSGIDENSISVIYEEKNISWKYDPEKSVVTVNSRDFESAGNILFEVSLKDRSGNTVVETFSADTSILPGQILVEQNSPNPFNPLTNISFTITSETWVSIEIYDLIGRKVRALTSNHYPAGRHTLVWNARDDSGRGVSSGVYFFRVMADSHTITRKMLLLQ